MNRGFQLLAGSLLAALGGAICCAADGTKERRFSAPVRVLPESKPAPPPANAPPRAMTNPAPTTTNLVPPQYRTGNRSQAPAELTPKDASSSIARFIVPLVERPVLVESRITIDGKPFGALREERIDGLLADLAKPAPAVEPLAPPPAPAGASDKTPGAPMQDSPTVDDNKVAAEANAAPPAVDHSLPARLRRYIQTTQRAPTCDELRWLLVNWTDGPTLLVLHENFERLRADQTPLFKTLDQDEDSAISAAEIARAADTLLKYDRNQDDVISLDELKAAAARTPEKRSQKSPEPAPLIPLADLANREVFASLASRYAAEDGKGTPESLTRWDANGDGRIDADELTRLAAAQVDLQIDVAFDSHDSSRSHVDVTVVDASLGQTPATVRGASVTLLAAGTLLELSAVQSAGEANADQISIGAVRDGYPLLPEIDFNEDGRLTLRELRQASQRLAEFDRNGDGAISAGEILPTLRVAIGRGATVHRQLAAVRSIHAPAVAQSVKAPDWFARMDRNKDGDVSRREFLGGQGQFDQLDADGDELISIDEAARPEKQTSPDGK